MRSNSVLVFTETQRARAQPMIASLLSEENRWVNGQRIEVSGGMAL